MIEAKLEESIRNARLFEELSHETDRLQVTSREQGTELKKRHVEVNGLAAELEALSTKAVARRSPTYRWSFVVILVVFLLIGCTMTYQSLPQQMIGETEIITPAAQKLEKEYSADCPRNYVISERLQLGLPLLPNNSASLIDNGIYTFNEEHLLAIKDFCRQTSETTLFSASSKEGVIPGLPCVSPSASNGAVKKQSNVDERGFEVHPEVTQHTDTAVQPSLHSSPSVSHKSMHGSAEYKKFRFLKGIRKVVAHAIPPACHVEPSGWCTTENRRN